LVWRPPKVIDDDLAGGGGHDRSCPLRGCDSCQNTGPCQRAILLADTKPASKRSNDTRIPLGSRACQGIVVEPGAP